MIVDDYDFNLGWFMLALPPLQKILQFLHLDFVGFEDDSCTDDDAYRDYGPYAAGSFRE